VDLTVLLHEHAACCLLQSLSQPESYLDPWGLNNSPDRVLGGLDKLGGALMGNLFAELVRELQNGLDFDPETQQQEHQTDWHGRMDRLFGGLSQRLGEGLEKQLRDEQGVEDQIQVLQQLLQRQLKAMTPPDLLSWLHDLTDQEGNQVWGVERQGLPGSWRDSRRHDRDGLCDSAASSSGSSSSSQRLAGPQQEREQQQQQEPPLPWQTPSAQAAMQQLEGLGAAVYLPTAAALQTGLAGQAEEQQQWGVLAGYEEQKQALEDCLLLPLKHPEVRVAKLCSAPASPKRFALHSLFTLSRRSVFGTFLWRAHSARQLQQSVWGVKV
jgi:hypothetical protein